MQTTENLPRQLRRKLEAAQDNPPVIQWDIDERLVIPQADVFFEGRTYRPGRTDRDKKGRLETIAPETFSAQIDDQIRGWWKEGKVFLPDPYIDCGRTGSGVLAFRPWPMTTNDWVQPSEFDGVMVLVKIKPSTVQPGMHMPVPQGGERIKVPPGMAFYFPWVYAKKYIGHGYMDKWELAE